MRAKLPSETLLQVEPYFKEIGITRVANVTGLDHINIPVSVCIRPNGKNLSVAQGKGVTQELADTSAIMESIELWHAEYIEKEHLIPAAYIHLAKQKIDALDPAMLGDGMYETEFLRKESLKWLNAKNLITNNDHALVPFDAISMDSCNLSSSAIVMATSSNGLASGNTLEEATCHALFEVIERHSHYEWLLLDEPSKKYSSIALNSIDDPINQQLIEKFLQAGVKIDIWDITSNIGIPAFYCEASDNNLIRGLSLFSGRGAHLDKNIALSRALTEAAQSRLTIISGAREDILDSYYNRTLNKLSGTPGEKKFSEVKTIDFQQSFSEMMTLTINLLEKNNIHNLYLINLTKSYIGIPVVKVISPNLKNMVIR